MRARQTRLACALLCWLSACDCGSVAVEVARAVDAGGDADAGAIPPVMPWGSYAANLDVPACDPGFEVLVIDTTADSLDGGEAIDDPSQAGPELSLIEAFWIGANRQRPHTISFDPRVFPAETPGRILITGEHRFPSWAHKNFQFCLDGRGRGVVLEWPEAVRGRCYHCVPSVIQGSIAVGLTLLQLPAELLVGEGQIAGCQLHAVYSAVNLGSTGLLGPGNALWGATFPVNISYPASTPVLRGNHFGYDPRTGELLGQNGSLMVHDSARFEGNVFAAEAQAGPAIQHLSVQETHVELIANRFGVDRQGSPLGALPAPLSWIEAGSGSWTVGPDNVFRLQRGSAMSLRGLDADLQVELTRNAFVGEGQVFDPSGVAAPVEAPVLASAGPDHVEGSCAVPGRVEVFSDPGALAETFLGEVACDAVSTWRLEAAVPRGRNVTATLTDAQRRSSELSAPLAVP